MAAESLHDQIRIGFPKTTQSKEGFSTTIEYIGVIAGVSGLEALKPARNSSWGDYPGRVATTGIEPLEQFPGAEQYGILTVTVDLEKNGNDFGFETGIKTNTDYEIDWVDVGTSMYQHPDFAIGKGGPYELTPKDIAAIALWKEEKDPDIKGAYQYSILSAAGFTTTADLSPHAKMFARGIELGIESYPLKMPVARKTETWVDGPPDRAEAGKKETPTSFPNLPSGYEWLRSSDRSLKHGEAKKWNRDMEWLGALPVYVDNEHVYWAAP
jgi:hypothetical protein